MLKLPICGNSEKEETHTAAPYIKADSQPGDSCLTSPFQKRQAVLEGGKRNKTKQKQKNNTKQNTPKIP